MSDVRKDVWATKMGKPKVTTTPDLKVLPPTTETFEQNVRRAHIQTAIWKSAVESEPPTLNLTKYVWPRDEASRSLIPIMLPPNVAFALSEVLEMIRCGCLSDKPCYTAQCRPVIFLKWQNLRFVHDAESRVKPPNDEFVARRSKDNIRYYLI